MQKRKLKKGISLIVLVITIIVMIILAAAIILSLNNTGIIGNANKAVDESNIANIKSAADLAYADYLMGSQEVVGDLGDYLTNVLKDNGTITDDTYYIKMYNNQTEVVKKGSLADMVYKGEILPGEVVNYNAGNTSTVTVDGYKNGRTSTEAKYNITSSSDIEWRVIGAEGNHLLLVSSRDILTDERTNYGLYGSKSYLYIKSMLDKACGVFGTGYGAIGSRSIRVEDIDYVTGFDKTAYIDKVDFSAATPDYKIKIPYGTMLNYDGKTKITFEREISGAESNPIEQKLPIMKYPSSISQNYLEEKATAHKHTYYSYSIDNEWLQGDYFLASQYTRCCITYIEFGTRMVNGSTLGGELLFMSGSNGKDYFYHDNSDFDEGYSANLRPVVILESNITGEKVDSIWNLK